MNNFACCTLTVATVAEALAAQQASTAAAKLLMISAQSLHSFTWPFACHLATPKKRDLPQLLLLQFLQLLLLSSWTNSLRDIPFARPVALISLSLTLSLFPPSFFCLSVRQFLLQFAHCGGFSLRSKYKGRGGGGGLDLPLLIRLANFIYIFVVSSFIQIIQIVVVYSARCCCCKFTLCTFSILNFVLMLRKFILSIERNFCCFLLLVVVILGFYFTHTHTQHEGGKGTRDS